MAKLLKLRRGSTTQHASFTGAEGEVTIDTTKDTAVVHDGAQAGGRPLLREDMSNLPAGTIDNADINASAAISGTKISPNFGSQQVETTGAMVARSGLTALSAAEPQIVIQDSDTGNTGNSAETSIVYRDGGSSTQGQIGFHDVNTSHLFIDTASTSSDILCRVGGSATQLRVDNTGIDVVGNITSTGTFSSGSGSDQLNITHSGGGASHIAATGDLLLKGTDNVYIGGVNNETHIKCTENGPVELFYDGTKKAETRSNGFRVFDNLDVDSGVDVTGNITVSGTVDGRDVAADGSKLDTYEANGSSYVRSDADDTASGSYSFTNSYNEFGNGTSSVSNDGNWNARVNIAGSSHARFDVKSVSDGIIATMSAHNGHNKAYMGTRSTGHSLGLMSDGHERATLSTSGNLSTTAQGTLFGTLNDGPGSGLDADTVDGVHASSFVRNDVANQSVTGTLSVGTGNTSSYITMKDTDNGDRSIHNNSNQIGFLTQAGGWGAHCDDNGNWTAVGNVTAYSDQKLKTNVNTINDALSIVGKLRGVSFDWKESGKHSIGLIAQEVEEVLPELVVTNRTTVPNTGETTEIKSVDYGKIVGVLINAINELKAEVDALKKPKKKGGK